MQSIVDTYFFFERLELDSSDIDLLSCVFLSRQIRLGLLDLLDHLAYWHSLILEACV